MYYDATDKSPSGCYCDGAARKSRLRDDSEVRRSNLCCLSILFVITYS